MGDNVDINFGRAAPGKVWEGKKRPKFSGAHVDPPNWTFFGRLPGIYVFRPLGVSSFYTPYNPLNCISGLTWGAGGLKFGSVPYF